MQPQELQTVIDGRYQETEFDVELGKEKIRLPELLSSKIFWALLVVALLVGGYVFLVKNLVKPPQLATNTQQT